MNNFKNISPVLVAKDLKAEIVFFERLGFINVYDSLNYSEKLDYAVLSRDGQFIHIQFHDENDKPSINVGQQIKIWVQDLENLHQEFEKVGFNINRHDDTPWGTQEFGIYSPNHNAIIFVKDLG